MLAPIGAALRLALCATLLAVGAAKEFHSEHRVILRYAAGAAASAGGGADAHLGGLQQRPDVVRVQSLRSLDMAVVSTKSAVEGERLVAELRGDDAVELAVLDTWVSAFDFLGDKSAEAAATEAVARSLSSAGQSHAQCSLNPACAARGLLTGDCCPTGNGVVLDCCSARGADLVSLRTHHGTYLAAKANGDVYQAHTDEAGEESKWAVVYDNDTITLRSTHGKFMVMDNQNHVHADRDIAQAWETFKLEVNEDRTISLKSNFDLWLSAEDPIYGGSVVADRVNISTWESFRMVQHEGPGQRFAQDSNFTRLWGMHHWAGYDIDAPEAWKIWTGAEPGPGITVAVIDTGIDYTHEDLREQMWWNPNEIPDNGIDDDDNGYVDDIHGADFVNEDGDPRDDQMHGTHCSGTIAGLGGNNIGVSGVAWRGVRLMALKFLGSDGSGRTSDSIRAIDYAVAHGARIASNSWGGGGSNPALAVAILHAEEAGLLFTAAAGNEGANNDEVPSFPANYDSDNVISVASTTYRGELSGFSCYGATTVDVAAPGSDIYSTVPDGGYRYLSGTSMATPHVSGLAALVWMFRPQLSMRQVKDVILQSTRKLSSLEGVTVTGGLINAKNALEAAWAFDPPKPPTHHAQGIAFEDKNSTIGSYSGVVHITPAADESDVEYYQVYLVSGAGYQLQALGDRVNATGAATYELELGAFSGPFFARALAVVTGRSSGENPAISNGPTTPLVDYGLPLQGARSATWSGDADERTGFVKGTVTIERAANEETITGYNIYWHGNEGVRGELLGSLAATGYRVPECFGDACSLLNVTEEEDVLHWTFARGNYTSYEEAIIKTSGPGFVTITRFETEEIYDTLTVGGYELHGNLSEFLPYTITLEQGPQAIVWNSDESVESAGWSFDLEQMGNTGDFEVAPVAQGGVGFEIVPSYKGYEAADLAIFVEVPDLAGADAVAPAAALPSKVAAAIVPFGEHRRLSDDLAERLREQAAAPRHKRPLTEQRRGDPTRPEFWLPASPKAPAPMVDRLVAAQPSDSAQRYGRVRVAVEFLGLQASEAAASGVRSALVQALATELKVAGETHVRASGGTGGSVVFDVEAAGTAPGAAATLDYAEAHLILLASGGEAAARLDAAMAAAVRAAGVARPVEVSARWGPAQRLSAKMVTAAARRGNVGSGGGNGRRLRGDGSEAPVLV